MKIKSKKNSNIFFSAIPNKVLEFARISYINFALKLFAVGLVSISLIFYGANLQRSQVAASIQQILYDGVQTNISAFNNYIKGLASNPEKIFIDINFEGIQALNFARQTALNNGIISEEEQEISVKAKITINKKSYNVRLSPTGLNLDMIGSIDKRAYKVEVLEGKKIYGMSEFKLLPPSARHRMVEWVGHELEKKEGLVALRYFFVEASLNGKDIGVYAIEEHLNKELLENNRSREGLIFSEKFSAKGNEIKIFNEKKYKKDVIKNSQIILLRSLIEAVIKDELDIERVFDLKKFAKHLAIIELMNSAHAFGINSFYYFNPVTNLIEPITREYNSLRYSEGAPNPKRFTTEFFLESTDYLFFNKMLKNSTFIKYYLEELLKISDKRYLDTFFDDIQDEFDIQQNIIFRESPFYKFPREYMYLRQDQILDWLNSDLDIYSSFNTDYTKGLELEIENRSIFPIYLSDLLLGDDFITVLNKRIDPREKLNVALDQEIIIEGNELKIVYKIDGIKNDGRELIISPKSFNLNANFPSIWNRYEFDLHESILINDDSKTISFKNNYFEIDSDLFIPDGYSVIGNPGLRINLLNGASLYSRSQFNFIGTKESPITIASSDNNGGGVAIFSTKSKNIFNNVHFKSLSSPNIGTSGLTASISIYDSSVEFDNVYFQNNEAEDFLNFIQSNFILSNSKFSSVKSDALDSDFSNGKIINTVFTNIGNDAVDFSGSNAQLENITIEKVGDKAISAGENSTIMGSKIFIANSEIGITSKDLSLARFDSVIIEDTSVGFAIFKKKEEFGGGKAVVSDLEMKNIELISLVDLDSELSINGIDILEKNNNVNDMLYGKIYGKSSK